MITGIHKIKERKYTVSVIWNTSTPQQKTGGTRSHRLV